VLAWDVTGRRLARQQAERFDWPTAVQGFLHAHGLAAGDGRPGAAAAVTGTPGRDGNPL
jgi:hypothetical protein